MKHGKQLKLGVHHVWNFNFFIMFSVIELFCAFFYWLEISGVGDEKGQNYIFVFEGFDYCRIEGGTMKQKE